jgi:hypothetical protein
VVLAFLVGGVTGVLGMRWQVSVDREAERDAANDPPGFVDIADRVV